MKSSHYVILSFLTIICIGCITYYQYKINYVLFLIIRSLFLITLFSFSIKVFHAIITSENQNENRKNIYTSLFSVFFILILLESIFTFIPKSHNVGLAYCSKNWKLYYNQLNQQQYRDQAHDKKDFSKKKILFIGDSFTQGNGIERPENRFAELFTKSLGSCSEHFIYAKGGMNSLEQLNILKGINFKFDLIVFQYYGNDILGDAQSLGYQINNFDHYGNLNPISELIVKSSYFINYFYWSFPKDHYGHHKKMIEAFYADKTIMAQHQNTLNQILEQCHQISPRIYCIIIPYLHDIKASKNIYSDMISETLNRPSFNSEVIDINSEIEKLSIPERVVNQNDAHASQRIHQIIADKLKEKTTDFCK